MSECAQALQNILLIILCCDPDAGECSETGGRVEGRAEAAAQEVRKMKMSLLIIMITTRPQSQDVHKYVFLIIHIKLFYCTCLLSECADRKSADRQPNVSAMSLRSEKGKQKCRALQNSALL